MSLVEDDEVIPVEVKDVIVKTKDTKAPGSCGVPVELIKHGPFYYLNFSLTYSIPISERVYSEI